MKLHFLIIMIALNLCCRNLTAGLSEMVVFDDLCTSIHSLQVRSNQTAFILQLINSVQNLKKDYEACEGEVTESWQTQFTELSNNISNMMWAQREYKERTAIIQGVAGVITDASQYGSNNWEFRPISVQPNNSLNPKILHRRPVSR